MLIGITTRSTAQVLWCRRRRFGLQSQWLGTFDPKAQEDIPLGLVCFMKTVGP